MSAINIPLSIMFPDILACRLILDLREQGHEVAQPSVHIHGFTGRAPSETSSTTYGGGSRKDRSNSVLPMAYKYAPSSVKGKILKGLSNFTKSVDLSTTIGSHECDTQDVTDFATESNVQVRDFNSRSIDINNMAEQDGEMIASPSPYHLVDMPADRGALFNGIRIDVEKTQHCDGAICA